MHPEGRRFDPDWLHHPPNITANLAEALVAFGLRPSRKLGESRPNIMKRKLQLFNKLIVMTLKSTQC